MGGLVGVEFGAPKAGALPGHASLDMLQDRVICALAARDLSFD